MRFDYPCWRRDDTIDVKDIEGIIKQKELANVEENTLIRSLVELVNPKNPLGKCNFLELAYKKIKDVKHRDIDLALESALNEGYLRVEHVKSEGRSGNAKRIVMLGDHTLDFAENEENQD